MLRSKLVRSVVMLVWAAALLGACGGTAAPETTMVQVYFVHEALLNGPVYVQAVERSVPADADLPQAAIEAMLEGPTADEVAQGYSTAIPASEEVVAYRDRVVGEGYPAPFEGDQVRLLSLEVDADGTALADFSGEMIAYGGGSMRVGAIAQQIEQTLLQFPEVSQVVIAIEGETEEILQP